MTSKKYLQGIETPSVSRPINKTRVDTNSKVLVKRLFCEALFCYCDVPLRCWDFLQMLTLGQDMITVKVKVYDAKTYREYLYKPERLIISCSRSTWDYCSSRLWTKTRRRKRDPILWRGRKSTTNNIMDQRWISCRHKREDQYFRWQETVDNNECEQDRQRGIPMHGE